MGVIHDKADSISFSQILTSSQAAFKPVKDNRHVGGFAKGAYWLKINISDLDIQQDSWFLEVDNAYLDSLTFYFQDNDGTWRRTYAGNYIPVNQQLVKHYHYVFPVASKQISGGEFYLRVKSEASIYVPLQLWPHTQFRTHSTNSIWLYGLLYGAMLFMFIYHMVVAVTLKSRTYLYFALFLLFNTLFQGIYYGHFRQFLFPEGGAVINYLLLIMLACLKAAALMFAIYFLRFTRSSRWTRTLKIMASIWFLSLVLPLIMPYRIAGFVFAGYSTLSIVAIIVAAYTTLRIQRRRATLFLIAWVLYLSGAILSDMRVIGLDVLDASADILLQYGNILNALLLALALADRINHYRKEQYIAKQTALNAITKQQQLAEQHRLTLENRVQERTFQLEEKQNEILSQNKKLFEQQQIIESQNEELQVLNGELERKVQKRTYELRASNKDLLKRKQQLEQFAFITSHNLRGPVASMIGLINLFKRNQITDSENLSYLDMLQRSVTKLDGVLKDLDKILKLEKNFDGQTEEILYVNLINDILEKLTLQVQEAQPTITTDFRQETIVNNRAYLDSILYNLLSNSLKYRHPKRELEIFISSWQEEKTNCFSVQDNGLGMDMNLVKDKLFTLYQRFHPEYAEGKGLGLYLLKSQVEMLKGRVEVVSEKGQGTTFTVRLPNAQ
jgi:signal transduction histidine kinase